MIDGQTLQAIFFPYIGFTQLLHSAIDGSNGNAYSWNNEKYDEKNVTLLRRSQISKVSTTGKGGRWGKNDDEKREEGDKSGKWIGRGDM